MCGAHRNAIGGNDMPTTDVTYALPEAADRELIEVAGNRIRIITSSASQLVCDYSAAPRFPARRCTSIRGSTRPILCWRAYFR